MQHLTEERLILFHYGEAEESQQIARHLANCPACRRSYDALNQSLGSMCLCPIPERGAEYGDQVWRRLQPELTSQPRLLRRWFADAMRILQQPFQNPDLEDSTAFQRSRWFLSAALAVLACGAFLAGRFWSQPASAPEISQIQATPGSATSANQKVPFKEFGDHLERSQLALIELINSKTNGAVDISIEQVLARELVDVNRLFCRTAAQLGDVPMMSALEDLEHTLQEISNSPSRLSAEQFAELRRRLGPDAVLCKIKVVGAQMRARELEVAQEVARHQS